MSCCQPLPAVPTQEHPGSDWPASLMHSPTKTGDMPARQGVHEVIHVSMNVSHWAAISAGDRLPHTTLGCCGAGNTVNMAAGVKAW